MIYLSRRKVIIAAVVALMGPVYASEGGRDEGSEIDRLPILQSQDFRRLSTRELDEINREVQARVIDPTVLGFRTDMTKHLFAMADAMRGSTFRLMEEMEAIRGWAARRARLEDELKTADDLLDEYEDELEKAQANNQRMRILRFRRLVSEMETYRDGVRFWMRDPLQGTFFSNPTPF